MSGSFSGFTEKDIEKINNIKKDAVKVPIKMLKKNNKLVPVKTDDDISVHSNMNSEPKPEVLEEKHQINEEKMVTIDLSPISNDNLDCQKTDLEAMRQISDNILNGDFRLIENYPMLNNIGERKTIDLEAFEKTQKLIEEQNKKRKEMLSKALEDRTKQTAEEAQRLDYIKKELQTLDAQLHDDVAILRKQIDKASIVYSDVEKNYFKVEKEFLQAKLALQKEKEKKELLTEHLCTLIAHNEARKAKKLESLMDQLVYKTDTSPASSICDGVCEKTGKMLEMENGQVIQRDDD